MAEKNIIRQDIVQILFETAGVEDILNSETALSGLKGALKQLAKDSEHCEESNKKNTQSMMGMFAQSELLGKLADAGKKVIDVLMDCVDASAEFQTSLAKLETIANTNAVPMETLSNDLLALSNDTGVAVTSLTESAYQAVSASVDTASAVDFVAQANELAAGGFTSTETAVDVLSTAINAYGLEVSEAGQLSDYLITTQNLGKTSVDQLAQSVGKVIPLASAYNVEMDNLSSAYAVLTANGIATAETGTYLKSMLTELADTGSTVAGVLQEETGMSFSELSASGQSLGDVLSIIGASVDNDATAFSNLWSSSEAGVGALSLLNAGTEKYNSVLNEMQNSTGAASQAYETMTGTAKHAQEELTNAANNLKIAVGNSLLDTFTDLNHKGADALNWLTDFVQEHETLVSSLTAGIAVAAAATVGIVGLSAAVATLAAAAEALNLTTGGALKIAGLIVGGIAALATGIAALNGVLSDGKEDVEDYDGTLEECRNEIELTDAALAKAKDRYGDNSDVVKDLESDLSTLNKQYEKGGGYLAELYEQFNIAAEAIDELQESIHTQYDELDTMNVGGYQAVSMLEALSEKSEKTNTDLDLMQSYADYLNDTFNCNIQVNYETGELTGFDPASMTEEINSMLEQNRIDIAKQALSDPDYVRAYQTDYESLQNAEQELEELRNKYGEAGIAAYEFYKESEAAGKKYEDNRLDYKEYAEEMGVYGWGWGEPLQEFLQDMDGATEKVEEMQKNIDTSRQEINELCEDAGDESGEFYQMMIESWEAGTNAIDELADSTETSITRSKQAADGVEEVTGVMEQYTDSLLELAQAYDDAYEAAYESFSGQFGLFDEATTKSDTYTESTVANAQKALDSQLAYWENYAANIESIQSVSAEQLGVSQADYDAFMMYIQNGSEQAAGLAESLAWNLEQENYDAVTNLIETNAELNDMHNEMAQNTADWQIDLDEGMQNIIDQMEKGVDALDLSGPAAISGANTMSAYISAISAAKETAVSETQSLVDSVQAVLDGAGLSYSVNVDTGSATAETPVHATGTTNAEDIFIAGEQGAELIVGMGGSTVFPASETERIIDTVADYMDFSGGYTPGSTSVRSFNSDITYAPVFNLTQYGGTTIPNQKQVKRWMRQTLDDAFLGMLRTNPPVYEI